MGIKLLFLGTCDGSSMLEPHEDMPNTYQMGVCKLDYDEVKNELTVHLRRPGILIGKAGRTINKLEELIGCKIKIIEVNLLR